MALLMTAKEFIEKVKEVQKTSTVYMWGTYGQVLDNALIDYKAKQYPSKNTAARVARHKQLVGKGYSAWDCVGLIKGILWGWVKGKSPKYRGSEVPDVGSDSMYKNYTTHQSTDFKDILPGEVVWIVGHIGVYIGDGLVIEATSRNKDGFTDNVLISALGNHGTVKGYPTRSWTHHGRLKWIDYAAVPKPDPKPEPTPKPEGDYLEHKVVKGDTPWGLATKYLGKGARYMEIMDYNGLKHDANIFVGQVLKIPVDCPPSEPEKPKEYQVRVNTARGLNVRSAPVSGSVLRVLPNKAVVTISKEDKRPSRTWGYVEAYKGWIALDFTLPVSAPAPPPTPIKEYKVKVKTPRGLNVRKSPTTASSVVKTLGNGLTVTISKEEKEGTRVWGYTSAHKGWIALDFTVKL